MWLESCGGWLVVGGGGGGGVGVGWGVGWGSHPDCMDPFGIRAVNLVSDHHAVSISIGQLARVWVGVVGGGLRDGWVGVEGGGVQ